MSCPHTDMARTGTGANLVVQDVPLVKKHIMREHPEMQDVVFLLVDDRLHVLLVAGYPPLKTYYARFFLR